MSGIAAEPTTPPSSERSEKERTLTTRDELIDGFRMIIREGLRVTSTFTPEDWKRQVHDEGGGWDRKEVYSHVAAVAEIAPNMADKLASVPEGGEGFAGVDIDAINAQLVAAKQSLSESELMEAFKVAHEELIEFVQAMPEEQLTASTKFGAVEGPVADVIDSIVVLHALGHIYSAGGSVAG